MVLPFHNPFEWLEARSQTKALWLLGTGTVLLLIVLSIVDQPLRTVAAPNGIVSFELAKNIETSREILNTWSGRAQIFAAFSLGIDYLFLIFYALFLGLAVFRLTRHDFKGKTWWARLGTILVWAPFWAAVFDALENYCLIRQLFGAQNELLTLFARSFALLKFLLIGLTLLYLALGLIRLLLRQLLATK